LNFLSLLKNKIVLGGLCVCLLIGTACFYFFGPTEKHVESLALKQNSEELVKLIQGRADSDYFVSTTQKATGALIDLSEKQYTDSVNAIGNVLISSSTKVVQKKAIINAFNEKNMIIPNFYKAYEINPELRDELKKNAIDKKPNIFKEKLLSEFKSILEQSKTDFSDYTEKVEKSKIWNIDGFANDMAFSNLFVFTKLYAIQEYVKKGNDEVTLGYVKSLKGYTNSNFVIKNQEYLEVIASCFSTKIASGEDLHRANDEMDRMHFVSESETINKSISEAENVLNSYLNLTMSFFSIDYHSGNPVMQGNDQNGKYVLAILVNPDRWNYSGENRYREYFVKIGETVLNGSHRALILKKVNAVPLKQRLAILYQQKRELDFKKQNMENVINQITKRQEENGAFANDLMNKMLNRMNKISVEELIAFSKDDSKVPIIQEDIIDKD